MMQQGLVTQHANENRHIDHFHFCTAYGGALAV